MNSPTHPLIFVYGTLKPGGDLWWQIETFVQSAQEATLPGFALYRVGWYPAITPSPQTQLPVKGFALAIHPEVYEETLQALDFIESEGSLFRRILVEITLQDRRELAWTYIFKDPDRLVERIEGNEFLLGKQG